MNPIRRRFPGSRLLALALAAIVSTGAAAASADATDDAFGALLAMPGAQPKEGGWIIPTEAAADEADLIARLQAAKKDGADFNAMRHGGTLLAHAIRAGKERTAIWLLRNGADPVKVLTDDRNADDIALRYHRDAIVEVLEGKYGLKPTPPFALRQAPVAPAVASAPDTPAQHAMALLQALDTRRHGSRSADEKARQDWQRTSAALSPDEFRALFEDGARLPALVRLTRDVDGGLENALARLPVELVRRHAQAIADALAEASGFHDQEQPRVDYTGASRSWPALWRRIDRPLSYDAYPDLASAVPPDSWAALFASGYANHQAAVTGCLLATIDLPQLQALWPEFERAFTDAHDEAAGLVLAYWRIDHGRRSCGYPSQAETVAKLAFLRAHGATGPVAGLRAADPKEPMEPALEAMVRNLAPLPLVKPQLVSVPPHCELAHDERWLDALVKATAWGPDAPPTDVQFVEVPGRADCGLIVSTENTPDERIIGDNFDAGPGEDPHRTRCADEPHDGEIWLLERDGIRHVPVTTPTRTSGFRFRQLRDLQTGRQILIDSGQSGPNCMSSLGLPDAFDWRAGTLGPELVASPDGHRIDGLLRRQCHEDDGGLACAGIDAGDQQRPDATPTLDWLRAGQTASPRDVVDALGADRRAAYRAALAAHDHARLRSLLASGIPAWWTAAEIQALAKVDLPLQEKRHRAALLFADPDQLSKALLDEDASEARRALGPWLPRQDWGPILRLVRQSPGAWCDARARFDPSDAEVGCDLDRAQGFLCGGGMNPEQMR